MLCVCLKGNSLKCWRRHLAESPPNTACSGLKALFSLTLVIPVFIVERPSRRCQLIRALAANAKVGHMFAKFYKTSETCTAERHVWFTASTPPDDDLKCECGQTTYELERDNAQQKEEKMTCVNKGGDGSRGGCGKMWVDVSYLWEEVNCPECLKLRPTKFAADSPKAGDSSLPKVVKSKNKLPAESG